MEIEHLHGWEVDPSEAIEIQRQLRSQVRRSGGPDKLERVAGADCAFDREREQIYAAVVLYDLDTGSIIERHTGSQSLNFPYVPGLLSFREMPALLPLFEQLEGTPDAIITDGHGYAHPRRLGLACHLGLFLNLPTVGCAKSKLVGTYKEPEPPRGNFEPLYDEQEIIGSVLRTRDNVNPVFVSSGHRISLPKSRRVVLECGEGYKLPEPQRKADHAVTDVKKQVRV